MAYLFPRTIGPPSRLDSLYRLKVALILAGRPVAPCLCGYTETSHVPLERSIVHSTFLVLRSMEHRPVFVAPLEVAEIEYDTPFMRVTNPRTTLVVYLIDHFTTGLAMLGCGSTVGTGGTVMVGVAVGVGVGVAVGIGIGAPVTGSMRAR